MYPRLTHTSYVGSTVPRRPSPAPIGMRLVSGACTTWILLSGPHACTSTCKHTTRTMQTCLPAGAARCKVIGVCKRHSLLTFSACLHSCYKHSHQNFIKFQKKSRVGYRKERGRLVEVFYNLSSFEERQLFFLNKNKALAPSTLSGSLSQQEGPGCALWQMSPV